MWKYWKKWNDGLRCDGRMIWVTSMSLTCIDKGLRSLWPLDPSACRTRILNLKFGALWPYKIINDFSAIISNCFPHIKWHMFEWGITSQMHLQEICVRNYTYIYIYIYIYPWQDQILLWILLQREPVSKDLADNAPWGLRGAILVNKIQFAQIFLRTKTPPNDTLSLDNLFWGSSRWVQF